jgi:chaperone modulatory protein CbpM
MQTRSEVRSEVVWIDERYEISLAGLAEQSGLSAAELQELVDRGLLPPRNAAGSREQWTFSAHCLVAVRTATRLRDDFELDTRGMAVALSLLERIAALEQTLSELRARLPAHP